MKQSVRNHPYIYIQHLFGALYSIKLLRCGSFLSFKQKKKVNYSVHAEVFWPLVNRFFIMFLKEMETLAKNTKDIQFLLFR